MEVLLATVFVAIVALFALGFAARRAITVCLAEVRDGRLRVVHGGVAPAILGDLADVVASPRVTRATLRIVRAGGLAELQISGEMPESQRQRLRNVVGSVPLARLANTPRRR
jgi:hypothetical protein